MQIKIGSTLFLGGNSKYQIQPPLSGLDSPAIRIGDGLYAGRDGGFVSGHFYGHRTIVIKGFYIGDDCEEADELRKNLIGFMRIRYKLPLSIQDFSGNNYFTEGYISNIKAEIEKPASGVYQLTFICPDPIIYDAGEGGTEAEIWHESTLTVNGNTTVKNEGNVDAWPIITVKGIFDGIEVINSTTMKTLQIDVQTSDADDEVLINMEKRIITLNGTSINELRSLPSEWWYLLQGDNDIVLNLGEDSGVPLSAEAKIKYKKGFAGI